MTSWRELAGCFAGIGWRDSLDSRVLDHIESLDPESPLLMACSAGADSVFLTLVLYAELGDPEQRMHLVHFNHGLRGADSDGDAQFVRELAEGLGLPVHIGQPESPLDADEASLRDARYDWMIHLYHDLGAGGLVLGHHADDLVESQLMAVLTGSGPAGLAAPMAFKRFSDGHVRLRPMLSVRRDQITGFLKENGIPWREDRSNQDAGYLRNWLRHECIPILRERIPQDIYKGTQRTHHLMQDCVDGLDALISKLPLDFENKDVFYTKCLAGQPLFVIRRAFMCWWMRHRSGQAINKGATDALIGLIEGGSRAGSVEIGWGQAIHFDAEGVLRITRIQNQTVEKWPAGAHWDWRAGPLYLPGGGSLSAGKVDWTEVNEVPYLSADPAQYAWLDWGGTTLIVRQWEAGDRYRPLGAPGSRKLQDIFIDAKLSVEQKHRLPVITDRENNILWVPGFPPAEDYRINRGCKSGLKLTYQPH